MRTRNRAHALTLSVASMAAVLSLTLATPNAGAAPAEPDPTTPTTSAQPAPEGTETAPTTAPSSTESTAPTSDAPSSGPVAPTTSEPSTSAPSTSTTPSTDAPKSTTTAPKPQARAAVAAGCQTYPPTSYQVCGRIRDKYNQTNGPNGFLSFPKSNELTNPNNTGKRSEFLGGNIYWSTATDAHPVAHDFLTTWGQYGYEGGFLKYPTTDEIPLGIGVDGRRQEFQGGYLYFDFPSGTHNVQGAILDKYKAMGGPGSYLGFPTSDETVTPDGKGRYNYFQNGAIYWSSATGAYPITGDILRQWSSAGFEKSSFGYPIADPVASPGKATEQRFQNGRLYTPGVRVPINDTGQSFSLGLGTSATLQASDASGTIKYSGTGFDFAFSAVPSKQLLSAALTLKDASAPKQFKMAVAVPDGASLQKSGSRVNVVDGSGNTRGTVLAPIAFGANGQNIPLQVSIANNSITYSYTTTFAFPGTVKFQASSYVDDLTGFEGSGVCLTNPFDCARSADDKATAFVWSEEDFKELVASGSYLDGTAPTSTATTDSMRIVTASGRRLRQRAPMQTSQNRSVTRTRRMAQEAMEPMPASWTSTTTSLAEKWASTAKETDKAFGTTATCWQPTLEWSRTSLHSAPTPAETSSLSSKERPTRPGDDVHQRDYRGELAWSPQQTRLVPNGREWMLLP